MLCHTRTGKLSPRRRPENTAFWASRCRNAGWRGGNVDGREWLAAVRSLLRNTQYKIIKYKIARHAQRSVRNRIVYRGIRTKFPQNSYVWVQETAPARPLVTHTVVFRGTGTARVTTEHLTACMRSLTWPYCNLGKPMFRTRATTQYGTRLLLAVRC